MAIVTQYGAVPKRSNKPIIIAVIIGVVVLLSIYTAGGLFLLNKFDSEDNKKASDNSAKNKDNELDY